MTPDRRHHQQAGVTVTTPSGIFTVDPDIPLDQALDLALTWMNVSGTPDATVMTHPVDPAVLHWFNGGRAEQPEQTA